MQRSHLRRAVIECYQKAVSLKVADVQRLYEDYKKQVIPLQSGQSAFISSPNNIAIRFRIDEIDTLREKGRNAKSRNKWDDEWEAGVDSFVEAFTKAKELGQELEDYLLRASQIKSTKKQYYLGWWGIISTIIVFILGTLLLLKWK